MGVRSEAARTEPWATLAFIFYIILHVDRYLSAIKIDLQEYNITQNRS